MNILLICMHIFFVYYAFGIEVSQVKCKDPNACGLVTGGPLLQPVTQAEFAFPLGLFWKPAENKFVFVDMVGPYVCSYEPDNEGKLSKTILKELDKKHLYSMIPILGEKRSYLLATDKRLYRIDFKGEGASLTWDIAPIMDIYMNTTTNIFKAYASKSHKLWIAGNTFYNSSIYSITAGELLMVDVPRNKKVVDNKYKDIIGFGWSKNFSRMYTISKKENTLYQYHFDPKTDAATNREVLFHFDDYAHIVKGNMTCATIDAEDNLWIGISFSGLVIRFNVKNKQIEIMISIPASLITTMAFWNGHLYVATASKYVNRLSEPGAGAVYVVSGTGSHGYAPNYVKIEK